MKSGTAQLSLHGGKCPAWLFVHMKALCAAIIEVILEDSGSEEVLRRLADPFWFQALGCVSGFDWHSSGLTTTVCAAIKEGMQHIGPQTGIYFAGGKGRSARKTPYEIEDIALKNPVQYDVEQLVFASKMAAKVDSSAVQDGYQIYHHFFAFTRRGDWAVIQQGMNADTRTARRYHWISRDVADFTEEPQTAICGERISRVLNLVAEESRAVRRLTCEMVSHPAEMISEYQKISAKLPCLDLPMYHSIPRTSFLNKMLYKIYEAQPLSFQDILMVQGVGASTMRALCLVAEVAYGVKTSYRDPVRYAFAHGGKDGYPFPVNEQDLLHSCKVLKRAVTRARIGKQDSLNTLKKLANWQEAAINSLRATPRNGSFASSPPPLFPSPAPSPFIQPTLFQ